MQIKLTETNNFYGSAQTYNPKWRNMELSEIEKEQQNDLKSYADVGYNSFLFNRILSTIYIQKIEVKTLNDIFKTDVYGLLAEETN